MEIDNNIIMDNYDKEWIKELKKDYENIIKPERGFNEEYFSISSGLGNYFTRNDDITEISNYMQRLLFAPNIAILDYILKHISIFQNLSIMDSGSGLGILSIFLKHINIKCNNFDDMSQLGDINIDRYKLFWKKYGVSAPTSTYEYHDKSDVLVCAGIWPNESFREYNFDYILADSIYGEMHGGNLNNVLGNKYKCIDSYGIGLNVYRYNGYGQ